VGFRRCTLAVLVSAQPERPDDTVAGYLAARLSQLGVTHVFELVGGMITVLIDAAHRNPELTIVSMHHEQGAGFAAEGFTRVSGRPAIAMATSGPGATNLLTAVGSCYFDSTPVVFITGQVNTHELRRDGRGRQGGFQETDIVDMARPVTKWAVRVDSANAFPSLLEKAFAVAREGRPGPVLLDIPMDVQRARVAAPMSTPPEPGDRESDARRAGRRAVFLDALTRSLGRAERPLVLAGGGVRLAHATTSLKELVERLGIPVVTSLMGVDILDDSSPLRAGLIGSYGNRWANWAVAESDVLIVLGSRLDTRQTGSDVTGFRGDRTVFHVDIDDGELNNHVAGCVVLNDDLATFLDAATEVLQLPGRDLSPWMTAIAERRREWPDDEENVPVVGINPNRAIQEICHSWDDVGVFVTDVGQHQMWAAQSVRLAPGQRFVTSGGMGSMGFGLPAAIGAALAQPSRPVCLVVGDGGLQCNIQELQTAVRTRADVRIVVFDNSSLGMVRQFQQSYFDSRFYSTSWGYSAPDFVAVARAYGLPAFSVTTHAELSSALVAVRSDVSGPSLIRLQIDGELNAYPKMAFGRAFGSMEPLVLPTEMEGT